ncbi:ArnT family glycosyltransferase, partial [Akkermansia muciniphila]|uniref:ArnT family glycosyltransferase n=1 Tax=Akkermansia muciniphila TaxID=239935 RepID=UPI001960F40D
MVPDKIDLMKNNLILRMFFALFGCFMILVCVNILTLKQPIMNIRFNIIFSALFIIIIGLFYFLLDKVDLNSTKKTFGILLGIIFLGIVIRLFVRLFLQTQTISDFATPHEFYTYYQENGAYTGKLNDWQNNDKYQNYYAKYPAWYPYLRIIMLIYDIFGKRVILIQFVNIVLFSLSALLVFFIIASMTAKKMALLGVLFWSLCPSLVIYSTITTPDHFSIFFILLTIYFWIKAEVSFKEQSHKNGETKFKFLL